MFAGHGTVMRFCLEPLAGHLPLDVHSLTWSAHPRQRAIPAEAAPAVLGGPTIRELLLALLSCLISVTLW